MNRIINHIFVLAAVALALSACKVEDSLKDTELGQFGITSVSAALTGEAYENDPSATFTGYPDDDGNILIKVPYFYPESSDNVVVQDMLKSMRVTAGMEAGTRISPMLGVIDMTKTYDIVATDAAGRTKDYKLSAEITELSGCYVESFVVTSGDLTYNGIILNDSATISIMATEDELPNCTISYRISSHATLTGYTEGMTLKSGDQITVTAHNGVDKTVYTILFSIPEKISYGARVGSGRMVWSKYYDNDFRYALTDQDIPLRLAVHGDDLYVLAGENVLDIDRATGTYLGLVDLPGGMAANSIVSDEAGNILFAANAAAGEEFNIYYADSMEGTPTLLLTSTNDIDGCNNMGNIRVAGDVTTEAAVTCNVDIICEGKGWQIESGAMTDERGITRNVSSNMWYLHNACFQPASSDLSDGVFGFGYWATYDVLYAPNLNDFSTAIVTSHNSNENTNCLSSVTFNGARYLAYGVGTHFSYSAAPTVYVADSSNPSAMNNSELDSIPRDELRVGGFIGASGASSDVLLVVSEDGYYMDMYFTDANFGIIICYEFDCIQQ